MTNEERILKLERSVSQLCECFLDIVNYLPPGTDWIEDKVLAIVKDIEEE